MQGQLDSRLSDVGRFQAAQLARALAAVPLRAMYSSPLSRALDTASVIAAPHRLPVLTVDAFKEIALGNWEGLTIGEVAARYPDLLAARRRDPFHAAPDGGETVLDVYRRAIPALSQIVAAHPGVTVAVVAHGAVNKAILSSVLESPLESPLALYHRTPQHNGAINIIEWTGGVARAVVVNETAHLDGAARPQDSPERPEAPAGYTPPPPTE